MTSPPNLRARLLALLLFVFLSGIVLLPLSGLSAEKIHWINFVGIYEPNLDVISDDRGAPGSAFFLVGEGYPPFTTATIYVDGELRCTITTNEAGVADFIIQTYADDPPGRYDITLSAGPNMSSTDDVELEEDEPIIDPPPGWNSVFCDLSGPDLQLPHYLPAVYKE